MTHGDEWRNTRIFLELYKTKEKNLLFCIFLASKSYKNECMKSCGIDPSRCVEQASRRPKWRRFVGEET